MQFKLISKSGEEVRKGSKVKCFRGVEHTVVDFVPPKQKGSTGKVIIRTNNGFVWEYIPSVFNLKVEARQ